MGSQQVNPGREANNETRFNRRHILQALGGGMSLSAFSGLSAATQPEQFDAIYLDRIENVISAPFRFTGLVDDIDDDDCSASKYEIRHQNDAQTEATMLVDQGLAVSAFAEYKVVEITNQTGCGEFEPSTAVTVELVNDGQNPPQQFGGVYDDEPVKQTPFTIPSDHGTADNIRFCVGPHRDYRRFKIQHEGEERPSATLFTPVGAADKVDRDATYEVSEVIVICGSRRYVICSLVEGDQNQPPTASFTAPQRPLRGESVTFDASGSSDPDGQITKFEWDFETDGTIDATGEQATHTFAKGGNFTVTLRVTDNDGATDKAQQTITVWIPVTIDIKPDEEPNPINPRSQGVVPVAIRQTANFDPTARVAVNTVRFGAPDVVESGGGATPVRSTTEGGDLILHFRAQDTGFDGDESQGLLIGKTVNGIPLIGSDSVKIVG